MTLRQLQYIITVAARGSITEAAKELFIAQPSLTAAIRELEQEMGITIFYRSRKGVELTPEGSEFLGYARQVMEQTDLIEEKYKGGQHGKRQFCVSAQHYSFAVEAFVELLKREGGEEYEFHMRETQTYDILEDVASLRSEIGVLYLNQFNQTILKKEFRDKRLVFHRLFIAKPHVFIGADNPLAEKEAITLEDLTPYPRLSYEQGEHNSFYFAEEILSTLDCRKEIVVRDRATLFNLLLGLNGYTICSGVINNKLNGPGIIAKPLDVDDYMEIGYLLRENITPGRLTKRYIEIITELTGACAPRNAH